MQREQTLELLRKGPDDWNKWRSENRAVHPDLERLELADVDLKGADFAAASLRECKLQRAQLQGANMTRADLHSANCIGANLSFCKLNYAVMAETKFNGADFTKSDLTGADLSGSDLVGTVFKGATLARASLQNAHCFGADFSDADLTNADLSGADLRDIKKNDRTKWPLPEPKQPSAAKPEDDSATARKLAEPGANGPPRRSLQRRSAQELIDQAVLENRLGERVLYFLAALFALAGLGIVAWGITQRDGMVALIGVAAGSLCWPAMTSARRTRKESLAVRLLEAPLSRADTAKDAADTLRRIFDELFADKGKDG